MQYNNIVSLAAAAILAGSAVAYDVYQWNAAAGDAKAHNVAGLDTDDRVAATNHFKANGEWPKGGLMNTSIGFAAGRDLLKNLDREGVTAFVKGIRKEGNLEKIAPKIRAADLKTILSLYDATNTEQCGGLSNVNQCANEGIALIFVNSLPSQWPRGIDPAIIGNIFQRNQHMFDFKLNQLKKINSEFVKEHTELVTELLVAREPLAFLDKRLVSMVVKSPTATAQLDAVAFQHIAKSPATSKSIDGKVFGNLSHAVKQDSESGKHIRMLSKDVFTNVNDYLAPEFITYASPEQISGWQKKNIGKTRCFMPFSLLSRKQSAVLNPKVYMKKFEELAALSPAQQTHAKTTFLNKWKFWKNIPLKVFKQISKELDLAAIIPDSAFKQLTLEERQLLLNSGDKDNATTCATLPIQILKGKDKRIHGLKGSSKCFKERKASGKWMIRALILGLFDGKLGNKLDAAAVDDFDVLLKRASKKDDEGKLVKRDDLELHGVLALEVLKDSPNGPEFVKSFFAHKEKDVLEHVCRAVDIRELRKTKWLQTQMTKACVKHLPITDLDEAKKLDKNIWMHMHKDQIKALSDRSDIKELEGPFMEGLAANKYFAAMSCKKKTKDNSKGDDVERKPLMVLIKASERSKYFGAQYVKNLPDDKECQENLAKHVASLADGAFALADAAYVVTHKAVFDNLRPEQYCQISDDLDAATYPATLQVGQVMSLSDDKVKCLSAKFLSHMTASGLSGFSAEQVKLINPHSLVLLCDEKASAIKHDLSEAQKEKLGKDCPKKECSMGPTNAHIGAFTAVAALAAGSIALLL